MPPLQEDVSSEEFVVENVVPVAVSTFGTSFDGALIVEKIEFYISKKKYSDVVQLVRPYLKHCTHAGEELYCRTILVRQILICCYPRVGPLL